MTDLSPVAQVVMDAVREICPAPADEIAAVALRAVACYSKRDTLFLLAIADELEALPPEGLVEPEAPTGKELCETYIEGYYACKSRQGSDAQEAGLRAVLARWG